MGAVAAWWRIEVRSCGRLLWALVLSLYLLGALWLGVSVLHNHSDVRLQRARLEACCETPEPEGSLLWLPPSQVRHTAAYYALTGSHPLLAVMVDDLANPCLAQVLLLLAWPLLVIILWHWDDLVLRDPRTGDRQNRLSREEGINP